MHKIIFKLGKKMNNLRVEIHQIKNIKNGILEFPIEKGIYCIAGSNGCGKSTIMTCLAQTIFVSSLLKLKNEDFSYNSYVKFFILRKANYMVI